MIEYKTNVDIDPADFIDLLKRSTLGERRPVDQPERLAAALQNSNLVISAWHGDLLVGIARSMTDFHYACYLSDLAVCQAYQKQGIGKRLIHQTEAALEQGVKLVLLAAPKANDYYQPLGFSHNDRCWVKDVSHDSV